MGPSCSLQVRARGCHGAACAASVLVHAGPPPPPPPRMPHLQPPSTPPPPTPPFPPPDHSKTRGATVIDVCAKARDPCREHAC
eukprot:151209-Pleurochrysis_carterae.AAC.3